MNIEQIKTRVENIAINAKSDSEIAHIEEDNLYLDFIRYVADHAPDPLRVMAREVMRANEIDYERWYS